MVYVYKNEYGKVVYSLHPLKSKFSEVIKIDKLPSKKTLPGYESILKADFENSQVWWEVNKSLDLTKEEVKRDIDNYNRKSYTLWVLMNGNIEKISFWFNREQRSNFITELSQFKENTPFLLVVNNKSILTNTLTALKMFSEMNRLSDEYYKVQLNHKANIDLLTSKEDVLAYDYTIGYPNNITTSLTEIENRALKEKSQDKNLQTVRFVENLINQTVLPASESLALKNLYPIWGEENAEFGKTVQAGFKLRVIEESEHWSSDILYEVIKEHTLQANWKPGIDTASLYKVVEEEHDGTLDDPIPYTPPMEIFKGKYYIQDSVKYLCNRDSGTPLSHNLADLVGIYVQLV